MVKSRGYENVILYNRIMDEPDGTSSVSIDLPNGDLSYVIGNLIQQGPLNDNPTIVTYAEEGATNPLQYFYAVNNTLVNDGSNGTFFRLTGSPVSAVVNNLMVGTGTAYSGTIKQDHNLLLDGCSMVDRAHYDYHLKASSGAIDAGRDPGFSGYHFNLTPTR